jgi:transcription initiation factor TFIIH subunit 4
MTKLRSLHVISTNKDHLQLEQKFRENLIAALTGQGEPGSFGMPTEMEDKNKVDTAFLEVYAKLQWETILHFMVGTEMKHRPGDSVLTVLSYSGLMNVA